jgi:hypothetical protein
MSSDLLWSGKLKIKGSIRAVQNFRMDIFSKCSCLWGSPWKFVQSCVPTTKRIQFPWMGVCILTMISFFGDSAL